MFNNILMVCVGNICRSPVAEVLLRQELGTAAVTVRSAGLAAHVGHPIEPNALSLLHRQGLDGGAHRGRQLSRALLADSDLVLVMERRHLYHILANAPEASGKTFLLGRWRGGVEVPDPYRGLPAAFEHAHALIGTAVRDWCCRLS